MDLAVKMEPFMIKILVVGVIQFVQIVLDRLKPSVYHVIHQKFYNKEFALPAQKENFQMKINVIYAT